MVDHLVHINITYWWLHARVSVCVYTRNFYLYSLAPTPPRKSSNPSKTHILRSSTRLIGVCVFEIKYIDSTFTLMSSHVLLHSCVHVIVCLCVYVDVRLYVCMCARASAANSKRNFHWNVHTAYSIVCCFIPLTQTTPTVFVCPDIAASLLSSSECFSKFLSFHAQRRKLWQPDILEEDANWIIISPLVQTFYVEFRPEMPESVINLL